MRRICFYSNQKYKLRTAELIHVIKSTSSEFLIANPQIVDSDLDAVASILPSSLQSSLFQIQDENSGLTDICLDLGRPLQFWLKGKRLPICGDNLKEEEINHVIGKVKKFGNDNRGFLDGQLHLISVLRSRDKFVYGLTIRVGRQIREHTSIISDCIFGSNNSILILGEPCSGKTSLIHEMARLLLEDQNLVVVDISNEIAEDGLVPHLCCSFCSSRPVKSFTV